MNALQAIRHDRNTPAIWSKVQDPENFITDVNDGKLPEDVVMKVYLDLGAALKQTTSDNAQLQMLQQLGLPTDSALGLSVAAEQNGLRLKGVTTGADADVLENGKTVREARAGEPLAAAPRPPYFFCERQHRPAVAVGHAQQRRPCAGIERQFLALDRLRPVEDLGERLLVERLEHQHPRPRQQRRVELERRVLGSGADQNYRAVFDVGQEAVLLLGVRIRSCGEEQPRSLDVPPGRGAVQRLDPHQIVLVHSRAGRVLRTSQPPIQPAKMTVPPAAARTRDP